VAATPCTSARLADEKASPLRALCQLLQRAELEGLKRASERDHGDSPQAPTRCEPSHAADDLSVAAPGEGVMELFDATPPRTRMG
jgi:hypothetical protein